VICETCQQDIQNPRLAFHNKSQTNKPKKKYTNKMPPNALQQHASARPRVRKWDALLTCITTSLMLNACLHYTLSPLRPHPCLVLYVCAGRVCISVFWVKLYQWLTGERRLDPFLNLAITFWVPVLVENWWR
jgi:hypothetical protein